MRQRSLLPQIVRSQRTICLFQLSIHCGTYLPMSSKFTQIDLSTVAMHGLTFASQVPLVFDAGY
ncbi:hypothetical protein WK55_30205 [Burkholderia ubonensis]|nr:hypothetical protein WK55_30205 [Burkholderia ubonensis]KVZ51648.1 hypothetical protein WL18_30920 [Burkholderia ubonensis]